MKGILLFEGKAFASKDDTYRTALGQRPRWMMVSFVTEEPLVKVQAKKIPASKFQGPPGTLENFN